MFECTKQDVLPKETTILQHLQQISAEILLVCGCQCPLLRRGVLRGSISKKDTSRLDKLIKGASSVVSMKLKLPYCATFTCVTHAHTEMDNWCNIVDIYIYLLLIHSAITQPYVLCDALSALFYIELFACLF